MVSKDVGHKKKSKFLSKVALRYGFSKDSNVYDSLKQEKKYKQLALGEYKAKLRVAKGERVKVLKEDVRYYEIRISEIGRAMRALERRQ